MYVGQVVLPRHIVFPQISTFQHFPGITLSSVLISFVFSRLGRYILVTEPSGESIVHAI